MYLSNHYKNCDSSSFEPSEQLYLSFLCLFYLTKVPSLRLQKKSKKKVQSIILSQEMLITPYISIRSL